MPAERTDHFARMRSNVDPTKGLIKRDSDDIPAFSPAQVEYLESIFAIPVPYRVTTVNDLITSFSEAARTVGHQEVIAHIRGLL